MPFFGGVEGGGTNTTVIIVNDAGRILSRRDGAGSNGWVRAEGCAGACCS